MGKFIVLAVVLMFCATIFLVSKEFSKSNYERQVESTEAVRSAEKNLNSMTIDGKTYSVYNKE